MVADDAVDEADNAPVEEIEAVTPELPTEPEAEPTPTPEAEAPSLADLIAKLGEAELAELGPVKDILRRREEGARRKAESDTTTKLFAQQQEYVVSGQAERELLRLAEAAAENVDDRGRTKVDPTEVRRLTTALLTHGSSVAVSQLATVLAAEVKDGFELNAAEKDSIELATVKYQQNPLDPSGLQKAWLAPLKRAWIDGERETIRAEVRAEMKREQDAAGKATTAAAAAAARKETPRPTVVNGVPVSGPVTWDVINKTYSDNQWANLPATQRDELAAQANAARANAGKR